MLEQLHIINKYLAKEKFVTDIMNPECDDHNVALYTYIYLIILGEFIKKK